MSKAASPTAHLIRNSRLMSMPFPSNPALGESQKFRSSLPTHQAITSPEASRSRGDWGLKRPIPKSVKNQYLRLNELDTINHQTTFESSHDTVITVKKWQEMGLPIFAENRRTGLSKSAFFIDGVPEISANPPVEEDGSGPELKFATEPYKESEWGLWSWRGKYIHNMSPGELKEYMRKRLRPRREEFKEFVEEVWRNRGLLAPKRVPGEGVGDSEGIVEAEGQHALEKEGKDGDGLSGLSDGPQLASIEENTSASSTDTSEPPNYALEEGAGPLFSTLSPEPHPTGEPKEPALSSPEERRLLINHPLQTIRYDSHINMGPLLTAFLKIPLEIPPLSMHPSAGLSYLYTSGYLENNPDYGYIPIRIAPMRSISRIDIRTKSRKVIRVLGGIAVDMIMERSYNMELEASRTSRVEWVTPVMADFSLTNKLKIHVEGRASVGSSGAFQILEAMRRQDAYRSQSSAENLKSLEIGVTTGAGAGAAGRGSVFGAGTRAGQSVYQAYPVVDNKGKPVKSGPEVNELYQNLLSTIRSNQTRSRSGYL